ncbi:MAG: adenosine kinase [Pseudomonadota bacterium]
MTTPVRIVAVGHALVDVLVQVDVGVIERHSLKHGGMHLVDGMAAAMLYDEVGPGVMQSGGSIANTIAHLAVAGIPTAFIGRVAEDTLGAAFVADLERLGVECPAQPLVEPIGDGSPDQQKLGTGRCVILVTPGGERTMSTYLGAAQVVTPADAALIPEDAAMVAVEGYLFDAPGGAEAIAAAAGRARQIGGKVVLSPSDAGCVGRHLAAMRGFIQAHCDIIVGNEAEMIALSGAGSADAALDWALDHVETGVVTLSEKGAMAGQAGERATVPAESVAEVVDTTGAGDAFAAGFLGAFVRGQDLEASCRAGCAVSARVITHLGARDHAAT